MEILAYGKINPALNVGATRADGFHEVEILMQQVAMFDRLIMEKLPEGDTSVVFSCSKDLGIPDEKNLAVRAAKILQEKYHLGGVSIYLEKNLPAAAGMAGGSTDAAAVLRGMDQLFEACLSLKELEEAAAQLGSDIPYCLSGGTAICRGRGEIVESIAPMKETFLLVFKPDFGVSTPWAYKVYQEAEDNPPADLEAMVRDLEEGDLISFAGKMRNQLYKAVGKEHSSLEEIISCMEDAGAIRAMMTGSGPTVFGLFDTKEKRDIAMEIVTERLEEKKINGDLFCTRTCQGGPKITM